VSVVGPPGIGKSRLLRGLVDSARDRARILSYPHEYEQLVIAFFDELAGPPPRVRCVVGSGSRSRL